MKKHPSILVCGQYACGKTSLIQAVCPDGTVPDEAIHSKQSKTDFDSVIYQTEVADFLDAPGIELGELAASYWDNLRTNLQDKYPWDCVWYCIDSSKGIVQRGDLEILRLAGEKTVAVMTKSELIEKEIMAAMVAEIETVMPNDKIITTSSRDSIGLSKLLDSSKRIIFDVENAEKTIDNIDEWDSYFKKNEEIWHINVSDAVSEYIYWGAGRAFVIAAVPIPLADVLPLIANEAYMITKIGSCYGYAVDESMLASFVGCLGGSITGKVISSFIPFFKAPVAAAVTFGVGCAAAAYFESDMSIGKDEINRIFLEARIKGENMDWKATA